MRKLSARTKETVIAYKVTRVEDASEWERLVSDLPDYSYEQKFVFSDYAARRIGGKSICLCIKRGDAIIGAAALRQKSLPGLPFGIVQLPSGPLLADPAEAGPVLTTLRREIVDRGYNILRLRFPATLEPAALPEAALDRLGFRLSSGMHAYRTALLRLDRPGADLRKAMHSKWRNQLNQSEKMSFGIEQGAGAEMVTRFKALYAEMRSFKSFESDVDPDFLTQLADTPFLYEVLIAHADGQDIGGHITCWTPSVATYILGANTRAGRDMRTGYALVWTAILNAVERGNAWYDLGGMDPEANPEGFRFKTRIGGQDRSAAGPYEARPAGLPGVLASDLTAFAEALYRRLRVQ